MFSFGRCSKSADLPNSQLIFYLYDLRQPPSQELCPGGIQLILVKRAVRQTQKVRRLDPQHRPYTEYGSFTFKIPSVIPVMIWDRNSIPSFLVSRLAYFKTP